MRFKRNTDVVAKAVMIANSGKLNEEEAKTIDTLIRAYCSTTYVEHEERHEFARQFVSDMVNDCCLKLPITFASSVLVVSLME